MEIYFPLYDIQKSLINRFSLFFQVRLHFHSIMLWLVRKFFDFNLKRYSQKHKKNLSFFAEYKMYV
jgi:hypothetical protein